MTEFERSGEADSKRFQDEVMKGNPLLAEGSDVSLKRHFIGHTAAYR